MDLPEVRSGQCARRAAVPVHTGLRRSGAVAIGPGVVYADAAQTARSGVLVAMVAAVPWLSRNHVPGLQHRRPGSPITAPRRPHREDADMSPTPSHPFCEDHRATRDMLHEIKLSLARIESAVGADRAETERRLNLLERVVFGGVALVCVAVGTAVLALVVR